MNRLILHSPFQLKIILFNVQQSLGEVIVSRLLLQEQGGPRRLGRRHFGVPMELSFVFGAFLCFGIFLDPSEGN